MIYRFFLIAIIVGMSLFINELYAANQEILGTRAELVRMNESLQRDLENCIDRLHVVSGDAVVSLPILEKKTEAVASWYGEWNDECIGCNDDRVMADGAIFNEEAFTAAANFVPLGTMMSVRYGQREIVVRVSDRMLLDSRIDLSKSAFAALAPLAEGVITVQADW